MAFKKSFLFLLFLNAFCACSQTGTVIVDSIISNGVYRTYRLYKPLTYSPGTACPMVFNFHGFTSNAAGQEAYGDFRKIADTANFIIVHPQGLPISGLGTTGPGWSNFDPVSSPNTDIEFISKLIDDLITKYTINLTRIYSTGMSNGGYMSYDMACFLSSRIAAIASVTGSMNIFHNSGCQASHPTPVMQIHGTNDGTQAYEGTSVSLGIDELVRFWVDYNHCDTNATFTPVPNMNTSDNCTAEHYVYAGGDEGSSVEFYKIIGGDHSWPGALFNINTTNMDFSASKEIWRFFSKHQLATSTHENKTEDHMVSIFPNPSSGKITLQIKDKVNAELKISNALGEIIFEGKIVQTYTDINLSAAAKGVYYYQLQNASGMIATGKIILE